MLIFPIVSVTFIEIKNGTVVNVDDQNTNVDFITGSSFKFESISNLLSPDIAIEYQLVFVPTSSVIFMIGENEYVAGLCYGTETAAMVRMVWPFERGVRWLERWRINWVCFV